ncbi:MULTISPECIES: hypothetical protein [Amycolatopsis]|uniref:Uncharacterized protein n=1 Tax=Amycolatopsis albidoflavus TaxID=102226 RepID=A0ABW5HRV1_9PSEU
MPAPSAGGSMSAVRPMPGEHDDKCLQDEVLAAEFRVAQDFGVELKLIGTMLTGTEEVVKRLHRTWDAGFQDVTTRLDEPVIVRTAGERAQSLRQQFCPIVHIGVRHPFRYFIVKLEKLTRHDRSRLLLHEEQISGRL